MAIKPVNPVIKDELSDEDIRRYEEIGSEAIKSGQLAVCTLAGGQGTRLGHKGPKGTFVIPFTNFNPISIFELNTNILKKCFDKYGVYPTWYIMTSKENDEETKEYFESHNYFGYPKESITFFKQGELPLTYENGEEVKDNDGNIVYAANGNGGIFKALEDEGVLDDMAKKGINYLVTCNVDNILINPIDTFSLGVMIDRKAELCIKSIARENPLEKVGTIVEKDGNTTVIEYIDMPKELLDAKNSDGSLLYAESHFGCNILSLDLLKRIADKKLIIHEAHKKNELYGEYIKHEMFIFDGFEMAESATVIRVRREDEFAPIKNKEGQDSPQTAIKLFEDKNSSL